MNNVWSLGFVANLGIEKPKDFPPISFFQPSSLSWRPKEGVGLRGWGAGRKR